MFQISRRNGSADLAARLSHLSGRIRDGVKWWGEHQAWPAIDEIRIDDRKGR